ncbi:hypothetical protein BjapCC829_28625 [Bradyrhizobium barranii]|uniref:Uncharacterized protein n=1 Tax=Bradyrhizobium barranii TaxID=2992140 RepID=A0ABY3QFA4_9BRAD|nr:hypothetical protein [Bradyrhizobium japonicum]UFW83907.1 hypothetical protein BjapCC829_28625 [Bradyrhizobium japonicum]
MKVKFKLPVGALVNGWRHLGGGEFAAVADATAPTGNFPHVLDGTVSGPDDELEPLVIVPFDDPLVGGYRKIAFADVSAAEAEAIKRATGRLIAAE